MTGTRMVHISAPLRAFRATQAEHLAFAAARAVRPPAHARNGPSSHGRMPKPTPPVFSGRTHRVPVATGGWPGADPIRDAGGDPVQADHRGSAHSRQGIPVTPRR